MSGGPRHRRPTAFSLPELIVVFGLIMFLFGLIAPATSRAWRQAEAVKCQSQLRQLGMALTVYANENRGTVYPFRGWPPQAAGWPEILFDQANPPALVCPAGGGEGVMSYQLSFWTLFGRIRIEGGNSIGLPASRIPLAGESPPGRYEEFSWMDYESGVTSWDPARHGPGLRSCYLWLDMHVDNVAPDPLPPMRDPWWVPVR
jgi:hypothetical protein